jgi:hypothetical protein
MVGGFNFPYPKNIKGINMLRLLKPKDKVNFSCFAKEHNIPKHLFCDFIRQKKVAYIYESKDTISGLIYVEKTDKDYLHIVSKDKTVTNHLLKIFFWHWNKELYSKIHKSNKVGFLLKKHNFRIIEKTDDFLTLYYNPIEKEKKYEH